MAFSAGTAVACTDNPAAASAFVDFMLSQPSQQLEAEISYEIPLVEGVAPPKGFPTAAELTVPGLDPRKFEDLDGPRELLRQVGLTM
jgi:iron(III) transport system substrate-binding protein